MTDSPDVDALREENRRLRRLLGEAEATARALAAGEVDAVLQADGSTPLLLANAQAALRTSERQFRAAFDGALDGLVVMDDAGVWVEANAAACLLLGRRRAEVLGQSPAELPFDAQAVVRLKRRGRVRGERRLPLPESGEHLIEYVATADFLPGRHLLVLRDTTARDRAERALRDSEERHRELFESNPHPILVYDPESRHFLAVNRAAVEQYGWSREEFLGLTGDDIRPPEDLPAYHAWLEQNAGAGSPAGDAGEWRHRRRDGSVFWASVFTRLVRWSSGPARLSVVTDVTERREAEEQLLLRERAIAGMSQGLLVTDPSRPDNPIVYVNPGFETLTGYPPSEALGRNCRFLQGPETDPESRRNLRDAIAAGRGATVELLNYRKDGTPFWNEVSVTPIRDDSGRLIHFVGLQTDVTARRALETQLQHAQRLEAVGRLAGGIAHDFNNLLGVILGYSEVLLGRAEGIAPEVRRRLDAVRAAAQRGAGLTRQLLAFSRRQVLVSEPVRLSDIVGGVLEMLERLIGEDVRLETSLPATGSWVLVDRGQMEQVLMNLVVNARDAMPQGGRIWIDVRDTPNGDGEGDVTLEVRDEGVGMDAETRRQVFEPFFTTKPIEKGTGLGLSTVFGIVTQSGGTIHVESEPGRGTAVTVRLPRVEAPSDSRAAAPAAAPRAPGAGRPRILLVEDEESLREVAREILESLGCDVVEADTAAGALERAPGAGTPADLLITDVVLPGLNGRQLAERLLDEGRVRRVLYTSGYTDDDVMARGVAPSGAGFLQKPYSVASLEAEVARLIGGLEPGPSAPPRPPDPRS